MDEMYRTLVLENEITIWLGRHNAPPGEPMEIPMITIAETIVKLYAPETAPQVKSSDQRCREAPFEYKMKDQAVEEKFLILFLRLVENHFLDETLSDIDNDRLAKIFCKKLPRKYRNSTVVQTPSRKLALESKSVSRLLDKQYDLQVYTALRSTFSVLKVRIK
jgi:hypothetical protein